jgi:hypothetical protein
MNLKLMYEGKGLPNQSMKESTLLRRENKIARDEVE